MGLFGQPVARDKLGPFLKLRQKLTPKGEHSWLDIGLASLIIFFFVISLSPTIGKKFGLIGERKGEQESFAQAGDVFLSKDDVKYFSNEILIKVKKEAKGKIREGKPDDTGIDSLNKLDRDYGVTKFEKAVKANNKTKE